MDLQRALAGALERGVLPWDDAFFDYFALQVHRHQYEGNPLLRAYWDELGARPGQVRTWTEIPPLPVAAFKQGVVACGDPRQAVQVFTTSGTTLGPEVRGRHYFFTLELYELALLAGFAHFLLPDGARLPAYVLAPPPAEAPASSLSYYFATILRELGGPGSRFFWRGGTLEYEALAAALAGAGGPVLLLGTAFAMVHFLDWCRERGRRFRLAPGSRLMETGGFKGRSRELPPADLYAGLADLLGLPPDRMVNQYGMTELTSNFYDPVLRGGRAALPRAKQGPPWARVCIRDPETLRPVPAGAVGLIEVCDLANLGSACAILTQDLGREAEGGFVVLGRAPGAVPRGCSIAADIALGRRD